MNNAHSQNGFSNLKYFMQGIILGGLCLIFTGCNDSNALQTPDITGKYTQERQTVKKVSALEDGSCPEGTTQKEGANACHEEVTVEDTLTLKLLDNGDLEFETFLMFAESFTASASGTAERLDQKGTPTWRFDDNKGCRVDFKLTEDMILFAPAYQWQRNGDDIEFPEDYDPEKEPDCSAYHGQRANLAGTFPRSSKQDLSP